MEEVAELIGGGVDDVESVACIAVGEEGAYDDAQYDAHCYDEWHPSVVSVDVVHVFVYVSFGCVWLTFYEWLPLAVCIFAH